MKINLTMNAISCQATRNNESAIGSVGLLLGNKSYLNIGDDEADIEYWIGEPHWGQGFIPEAVREVIRHALFEELGYPLSDADTSVKTKNRSA